MDNLPIFLGIKGKKVVVDGGDTVAARRVERARSAGARVWVFDPHPTQELQMQLGDPEVTHHARLPTREDVRGAFVVWGASEDDDRDTRLYQWTREEGCLANIADRPELCDFITPSIVDRSPIVVAVSTGGVAPVIGRILRARIESTLPATFGRLARFVGQFRARIATTFPGGRERRHFWENMIEGPAGDLFLAGDTARATARIEQDLADAASGKSQSTGEVWLVGAGPGDPDLLTFRALRLMQRADVVLYDRLIGEDILALVRRDATRIYVGKAPSDHTMSQEEISARMVRLAREGNRVLRLKGGDPFIFGRGGEEIEVLAKAGIGFQVVPGITAAAGCGAYAGIPLTHRDHAQSCVMVTAHGRDGVLGLDWEVLVRPGQTTAIYMGLSALDALTGGFAAHGIDMSTPVAVIENGTRPDQRVVTGTLADIATRVTAAGITGPSMILVGSVVRLRDTLNWGVDDAVHEMSLASSKRFDL
ncbi:uroporphyrinogen-III C-methyltransferase [Aquicoccus porphyridii]|uniref:Uroporphyrinogen-III C-methyltransferase n=1 Tax=Aquicoccus porphyridii TaxID=1852029 RepID=A0A5A9ZSC4_9RHOB|nr:siroheme synthase CysG [Aquicoccus porphyridii]KAA0920224.1 uroporphyrinogen-III C-methyltransferase [Aquicoccus porphyridii]RAI54977.1 uroporphyrinogen-III C-methyltransferase [Rhodobacteraceae bacterium AsT-22]